MKAFFTIVAGVVMLGAANASFDRRGRGLESGVGWSGGWSRVTPTHRIDFRKSKYTLFQAVGVAERDGRLAVSARFEQRAGALIISVEVVKDAEADPRSAVAEFSATATAAAWKPSMRPVLLSSESSPSRSRCVAVLRSKLSLGEAITFAECVTDGDVQAIAPVTRGGQVLFSATIVSRTGEAIAALIDPESCELTSVTTRK